MKQKFNLLKKFAAVFASAAVTIASFGKSASAAQLSEEELSEAFELCVQYLPTKDGVISTSEGLLITEFCPIYNFDLECFDYRAFVLEQGRVTAILFTALPDSPTVIVGSHVQPELDKVFLKNKPIAFVMDQDGLYFVTEDSVELMGQDLIGNVSLTPLEGKDFSVFYDLMSTVKFIRLDEYLNDRGDYKNDSDGFVFYQFGWNEIGGNYYYVKSDGSLADRSTTIGGVRYKFDENGVCQGKYTGFTKSDKGRRYWKNGKLIKNSLFKASNGKDYSADSEGYLTAV